MKRFLNLEDNEDGTITIRGNLEGVDGDEIHAVIALDFDTFRSMFVTQEAMESSEQMFADYGTIIPSEVSDV